MQNKVAHTDVLIVGAGISGIGAAWHLQDKCPSKTYTILEGRDAIGGTWDLFRYPGIRSDSDMYTLGYSFKPWEGEKAIADGDSIRDYVRSTAKDNNIEEHIQFGIKVLSSAWSSVDAKWTVHALQKETGEELNFTCNYLMMCTGYYNYEAGFTPEFKGKDKFKGQIIHPQHWPEDLDYEGKRVVVIGSGATAVTVVPAIADKAKHVTMLQRSPTYMLSIPQIDPTVSRLRKYFSEKNVYKITRAKNVSLTLAFFNFAQSRPKPARKLLLGHMRKQLADDYDMKHFTPSYNPWDERLCAVPNGDFFTAIREEKVTVVTDKIDSFTAKGIKLESGVTLEADIIVTATGLDLELMGGMEVRVDDEVIDVPSKMYYKGMAFEDVPNLAMVFGYTNASWTLKADLTSEYVCRLLNHMDKKGTRQCTPVNKDKGVKKESFLNMKSGYIQRVAEKLPKQGDKAPWRLTMNYALDLGLLRYGKVADGVMKFTKS